MLEESKKQNNETKKIKERETTEGKRLVTISKGSKKTTRLDHKVPSWMTSDD